MKIELKPPYHPETGLINLASPLLDSRAVAASDEFFAPLTCLLADSEPIFRPDVFDEHGKWMDGWETRRSRRTAGGDWGIIHLGVTGNIKTIEVNTRYFTGNYPPQVSLQGCLSASYPAAEQWHDILPISKVQGDAQNIFQVNTDGVNWVKFNIYPDGGVARLRLYGDIVLDWDSFFSDEIVELSGMHYGGRIVAYSDAHYGNVNAIISLFRAANMGDGWETRRRRDDGNDWIIIALAHPGYVHSIVVDTLHFRGNYPESCLVQAALVDPDIPLEELIKNSKSWPEILPRAKLEANHLHRFGRKDVDSSCPCNYVRLNIHPDGGVSRFRVNGLLHR